MMMMMMSSLDAPLSPDLVTLQWVRPGRGSGCKQLLTLIVILILVNLWVRCEKQFVLALRLIYLCVIPLLKHMKAWLSSLCTVGLWAPGYLWPYTHAQLRHTRSLSSPLFEQRLTRYVGVALIRISAKVLSIWADVAPSRWAEAVLCISARFEVED